MYICICVCNICMYVCMYIRRYVCIDVHLYVCIQVLCMYLIRHRSICLCMFGLFSVCVYVGICMYIGLCVHVCIWLCLCRSTVACQQLYTVLGQPWVANQIMPCFPTNRRKLCLIPRSILGTLRNWFSYNLAIWRQLPSCTVHKKPMSDNKAL